MCHCIKQLEEKLVATPVNLLVWSDRMDLVAASNAKGEVSLHRLTWAKVINLVPYKEGITVKGLAWKPDGKVIAIGYSTSRVVLMDLENKGIVHELDINGEISYMCWVREKVQSKNVKLTSDQEEQKDYLKYLDYSATFLPDPPPLSSYESSRAYEEYTNANSPKQTELNMLVVGTLEGLIYISIYGCFPWSIFDLSQLLGYRCSILSISFTEELNILHATIKDEFGDIKIVLLQTSIFKTHTKELFAISAKHELLTCLLGYLSSTISAIKETYENILLEMDGKLSSYASKVPEGTLATDFLDLLMFGITTEHMQEFLLHDLTKKGLEKFGQTMDMNYVSIQKLLLRNVTKVGQNVIYHLAELRGMARFEYRYKILGLSEEEITEAISAAGAFINKSGEMQQVINISLINYKAFFRWLFSAIAHLVEEPIPLDSPKMTQQDIAHITEFLLNFDDVSTVDSPDGTKKPKFVMEKIGQYLEDAPIKIPSEIDTNEWNTFLSQNECIASNPSIINHNKHTSLIQQFNILEKAVSNAFDKLQFSLMQDFKLLHTLEVANVAHSDVKISNISFGPSTELFALLISAGPSPNLYFLEINTEDVITAKGGTVLVSQSQESEAHGETYDILDIQFYSTSILSLLLQERNTAKTAALCQCPVNSLREKIVDVDINTLICDRLLKINATNLNNTVLKSLEGLVACRFAVSGFRNVSVVLADSKRKVRIYEMEAEEDEEDAEMTCSTVRESDISMPENSDGD